MHRSFGCRSACTVTAVFGVLCAASARVIDLVPAPQSQKPGEGNLPLAGVTYSVEGEADYAAEVLARAFGSGRERVTPEAATLRLRVADSADALAAAAKALGLEPAPEDRWREAFVLDIGVRESSHVEIIGGPTGVIYGVYALWNLKAATEGEAVPRLAISDWPAMLTRGYTGCPRDVSPRSLNTLDWLARWRVNAAYYEIYGDQGQDSVPLEVADVARECSRRGIKLYGLISNWRTDLLLKRELCASNPEDLAHIRRYATELLDRGCDGLIFLFDDLTQGAVEHTSHCEQCKGRFDGLAAAQLELMRPMLEVARERGVTDTIVCPTPYYDAWRSSYGGKLEGQKYYAIWAASEQMAAVQQYHCLLRREDVAAVEAAGLRNYIYWCNGIYSYDQYAPGGKAIPGLWSGLPELGFGWYVSSWDAQRGTVARPGAYDAFRELPKLTQHAWLCNGGDYPWALWGVYCWEGERFEPQAAEDGIVRAMCGPGAEAQYGAWKQAVRKWLPRLYAPSPVTDGERVQTLMAELDQDAAVALEAAGRFSEIVGQAKGVAPAAWQRDTAQRMVTSAEELRHLAEEATAGKTRVTIERQTETQLTQGVRRERVLQIGSFWGRYVLRYSQTEEPDGSRHRSQWHFGSGLGMLGPSYRNWYDAGFIDVLLNGQSLDTVTPKFEPADGPRGQELVGTWETKQGTVVLRFSLLEGGLCITGSVRGADQADLRVRLFAIPGAGMGDWPDMDKFTVTDSGEVSHGTPVSLKPGEDWLLLADRTYDVPREHAEGPCAVLFGGPAPTVTCDNGRYVVQIDAVYPQGTQAFSLVVWDLHGMTNVEGLVALRRCLGAARGALGVESGR